MEAYDSVDYIPGLFNNSSHTDGGKHSILKNCFHYLYCGPIQKIHLWHPLLLLCSVQNPSFCYIASTREIDLFIVYMFQWYCQYPEKILIIALSFISLEECMKQNIYMKAEIYTLQIVNISKYLWQTYVHVPERKIILLHVLCNIFSHKICLYSKTCLIQHLCNPLHWFIWRWHLLPSSFALWYLTPCLFGHKIPLPVCRIRHVSL